MKLKRIIAVLTIITLTLFAFSACGGNGTSEPTTDAVSEAQLSAADMATKIYENVTFKDMMTQSTEGAAKMAYELPENYAGDCGIYVSTGATPEEIAVFKADENFSVTELTAAAELRMEKQKNAYAIYGYEEVPKIENAQVLSNDEYVVICVSDDSDAAKIFIEDLLK